MHTQAKLQAFAQHIIDTEGDTIGYWPEEFLVFKLFATSAGDITRKEIEDYKEYLEGDDNLILTEMVQFHLNHPTFIQEMENDEDFNEAYVA